MPFTGLIFILFFHNPKFFDFFKKICVLGLDIYCYNTNRPGEARQPGVLFSYSRLSYNGGEIGLTRLLMD